MYIDPEGLLLKEGGYAREGLDIVAGVLLGDGYNCVNTGNSWSCAVAAAEVICGAKIVGGIGKVGGKILGKLLPKSVASKTLPQSVPRTGTKGVVPDRHNANVMVTDESGNVLSHQRIVSGNMTPEEQALGFPKGSLASHTEARAVNNTVLNPGDNMTIVGQSRPCPSCKGAINKAAKETDASIQYKWREGGQTQIWNANK